MEYPGPNSANLGHLMTISGAIRPDSGLFWASKWLVCSRNGPLRASKGDPKGPKIGHWYLLCKHWPVGPLCGVWNQIWCSTRLPEGQKSAPKGSSRPPLTPLTPLNLLSDPPYNQLNSSSYLITHWFCQNHQKMQKMSQKCKKMFWGNVPPNLTLILHFYLTNTNMIIKNVAILVTLDGQGRLFSKLVA